MLIREIGVGDNAKSVALYLHIRLALRVIARTVAATGTLVIHIYKYRWS